MYGFIILAIVVEGVSGTTGYFHSPGSGYTPYMDGAAGACHRPAGASWAR
jgi:hypothetical protein